MWTNVFMRKLGQLFTFDQIKKKSALIMVPLWTIALHWASIDATESSSARTNWRLSTAFSHCDPMMDQTKPGRHALPMSMLITVT